MSTRGPLSTFLPPEIPERVFHDDAGRPIDYGNRWTGQDGPAEWSYSVERNPERFAPLVEYTEALIEHLTAVCDVEALEGPSCVEDFLLPFPPDHSVARVVRLTPADATSAPMTFAFSTRYRLAVHAGLTQDFLFPVCSCEACDATGATEIARIAELAGAVTTGRFQEIFGWGHHGHRIGDFAGAWGRTRKEVRHRVRRARRALAELGAWQPWPLR